MCGIFFSCQRARREGEDNSAEFSELFQALKEANTSRGPDVQDIISTSVNSVELNFFASELRLRGDEPVAQPHHDDAGNILCWNGEIFEGIEVSPEENDGIKLFGLLQKTETAEDIRDILGCIEGPYALVYYHKALQKIFIARDPLGRRSLLVHMPNEQNPRFLLSSVSIGAHPLYDLEELSTRSIFYIDVDQLSTTEMLNFDTCLLSLPRQRPENPLPFAIPQTVNRVIPGEEPSVKDLDHIPDYLVKAVDDLIYHLDRSVMLRVRDIPQHSCSKGNARVAVLFSGGIDSTMLAYLAHRHIPLDEPIDLLNVGFENPRKILVQAEGNLGALPRREKKAKLRDRMEYGTIDVTYNVPDRLTGLQEVEELRRLCPGRLWNFVEINVPYEEYQGARATVEALMFPGRTVMDLSLAIALYFAARGIGQVRDNPESEAKPYTSTARVLLNGLGSDELLGGYGRYRTAYKAAGWQAIIDELQLEIDRIPARNLGRDDRVISSHGKETRHPFLSLSVVSFLAQLPVQHKLDPRLPPGLGEKMLLRLAARKVGLVEASARKKRAMQFGSHSARMSPGEADRKGDLLIAEQ
ncbi:hypothetical protein QCA50_001644 [Cerrena zonata]|uniref:Glutamine amidotransferase type-2 domain-containing protein n=1 Tax=Cerrena zonata TaxID=2478898 RepID=A0AAW0GVF5_9APHY